MQETNKHTQQIDETRQLPKNSMNRIKSALDNYARTVFGDKYGQKNEKLTNLYFPKGEAEIYNNVDIAGGPFSISNSKLNDNQTLIINFTSALGCPSMNDCPITQKACYAVAGENRLSDVRRKNLIVQNLVTHAQNRNLLDGLFDIAEMYIIEAKEHTRLPIKYIRYNEAGDFMNQDMLIKAARFSKKMRDKYGVMSMAYTANKRLDLSEYVDGEPIDSIIAINRSRNDIKHSPDALDRNFFGIPMNNFSTNPNINLENSYCDVDYVDDADLNHLKVETPIKDKYGNPTIPVLNKGSWSGGSGYYYICPCSFWKYNKDKATKIFLMQHGLADESFEMPTTTKGLSELKKMIPADLKKQLNSILKKIVSPCGTKCSVCHDINGGVTKDGQTNIKNYAVLAATHGPTQSNYDPQYGEAKRRGDDSVQYKDKNNPHGLENKYKRKYSTDAPIRADLFGRSEENRNERNAVKEEFFDIFKKLI
jgi:hypothetical protein